MGRFWPVRIICHMQIVLYCIVLWKGPGGYCPWLRLIVQTLVFSHFYLHYQVSPPETLVVKGGTTWARNGRWILPENARLPRNIQGSFTCRKSTTWDKRLYFSSERRRAEDFLSLKNPTVWAGFEPANLGTRGQHATSRPPKQLPRAYTDITVKKFQPPVSRGICGTRNLLSSWWRVTNYFLQFCSQ